MEILNYKLDILPPIIPRGFVLFRYNRVVNFHDENVIAYINLTKCHDWNTKELFELTVQQMKLLSLDFVVLNQFNSYQEEEITFSKFKKINSGMVRNLMAKCPLWAINQNTIVKIPNGLDKEISKFNFSSKEEYISELVKVSYAIRVFLLENEFATG